MSAAVKCAACQDTGSLPGSPDLDCASCGVAIERAALEGWATFRNVRSEDLWAIFQRGKAAGAAQAVPAGWQPIETAPMDKNVLLWWRPIIENKPAECVVVGAVSSHAPGMWWNGARGEYRNILHITHWRPLPDAPKAA